MCLSLCFFLFSFRKRLIGRRRTHVANPICVVRRLRRVVFSGTEEGNTLEFGYFVASTRRRGVDVLAPCFPGHLPFVDLSMSNLTGEFEREGEEIEKPPPG